MGLVSCSPTKFVVSNVAVPAEENYNRKAPDIDGKGQVHLLICALDYNHAQDHVARLTCVVDGKNFAALAAACGIQDVVQMYDSQCTKEAVLSAIEKVGGRCGPDDYFMFYYSGHGIQVEDEDGDESDDYDEAMAFVDTTGIVNEATLLVDDDFAVAITEAVDPSARIIVLSDCCHSATICDFNRDVWDNREAISISGSLDEQTSADTGKGGVFTNALLLAIDMLEEDELEEYSVGMLFNATIEYDFKVFNSVQNITLQTPGDFSPDEMAWPLVPRGQYLAPLSRACHAEHGHTRVGDEIHWVDLAMQSPEYLRQFGISAHVRDGLQASRLHLLLKGEGKLTPSELATKGKRFYNFWRNSRRAAGKCAP
mmetsp:Transcript_84279/g.161106  ORF Transcript_84279/g.161106 Transcript_84279/m.161106 type:complete len:369 (-) Transcript_84279:230-1336(-)